ncbi:MAG: MBL fold metallo-hydrolase [Coriobacteriia bacterium]|nr:MBL fold metallo-hydrolase [Coriobacteriia bacterium]
MDYLYDDNQAPIWDEIKKKREGKGLEIEPNYDAIEPLGSCGGLRLHVLGSGSKGNSCVVEGTQGALLIDAGFSKKASLERLAALNIKPESIKAILLTHEHYDHTKNLGVIARALKVPVYATFGTASAPVVSKEVSPYLIHQRDSFDIAGIRVKTFPTSHDANEPVAFRFESDKDALAYLTDSGVLSAEAKELLGDARILALESNYDPKMLEEGPYPLYLKKRIASDTGHLSNVQALDALKEIISSRLQTIVGMHLSETNNHPEVSITAIRTLIQDESIKVYAARQNRPISYI